MKTLLSLLVLLSLLISPALAGTFEAKYNTAQYLPAVVLDGTDGITPEINVAYTGVTVWYKKGISGTWTQFTLSATACTGTSGDWCQDDATNAPGSYKFYVPASLLDTKGKLFYVVKGAGYKTYWGALSIKTNTEDEESDSLAAVLDDTGTAGVVVASGSKTGYALSAAGVDDIWEEAKAGHTTAGTFGYYLDAQVSAAGGGGGTADWTADEKNQLRYRLGIDGTEAAPATNTPTLGTLTANVADKTGFSLAADQSAVTIGTVGTVTNPVTAGTVTDKTGYSLSTAGVDAILNDTIEGSYTARQVLCAAAAVLFGKASGGATTSITFRNLGDSLNRVSETVDANGNRTAVTLNLTGCQ